nr:immunoglobulin heavy chain junction region [Mus musculus]
EDSAVYFCARSDYSNY